MHRFFARARACDRPLVLGHRGAKAHATENTISAFALAQEHGADGVEFDVQLSADSRVVVFHDHDLRRLAGRGERVGALALTDLQAVRIGRDERIPTLENVLDEFKGNDFVLNIEIKAPGLGRAGALVDRVLEHLDRWPRRHGRPGGRADLLARVLVSSFDPFAIARVRRRAPDVATGYLFHRGEPAILKHAWRTPLVRPHALHPEHVLLTERRLASWRRRNRPLGTWTVDGESDLRRIADLGLFAIISNDPRRARQILDRTGRALTRSP